MSSHVLLNEIKYSSLKEGVIIEIGSARETNNEESSTFYFNQIAINNNTEFFSVDFSEKSWLMAKEIIHENAILSDGKLFLQNFRNYTNKNISVLYLDNFDVIYNEKHKISLLNRVGNIYQENNENLNNQRAAEVHLEQLVTSMKFLNDDAIIIIDDTKFIESNWWGKGALVVPYLFNNNFKIIIEDEGGVMLKSSL
jgi:hypothetical protein